MQKFREWLRRAYAEEENPCRFLFMHLSEFKGTSALMIKDVTALICDVRNTECPVSSVEDDENPMRQTAHDIANFMKQLDRQRPGPEALLSQFCYFSTSMTHIWVKETDTIVPASPIMAYVNSNKPMPYVFLNILPSLDTRVELVKHTLSLNHNPLRIAAHIVDHPGSLVSIKMSFDLDSGDCLAALSGDFMQLAIRGDQHSAYLQSPCKRMQCVVVIAYENKIHGVFYNDGPSHRVHSCVYACHCYF